MSREIPADILKRAEELKKTLSYHSWRYNVQDDPEISDAEYDALYRELVNLEAGYPELVTPDSPTQKVGGEVSKSLPSQNHSLRMYSLDNVFNLEEWREFVQRGLKLLPGQKEEDLRYWVEPKMDGLAMELIYENGVLATALTRGDGEKGEVVTANMRTVKNVPLRLRGDNPPRLLEVRGEVVIARKDFEELNARQEKSGGKLFANPRNAAAGSVRQLDSSITASRPLRFIAYGIGLADYGDGAPPWKTQEGIIRQIADYGLATAPEGSLLNPEEVEAYYTRLQAARSSLVFDIDGVVAKLDRLDWQESMGFTSHAPRWAMAMKFPAIQARTRLINIDIQVGRTGALTPVAILEPVNVGGVVVSRATLHNEDEIQAKGLMLNDTVVIQRAGDVIPEVVESVKEKRDGSQVAFEFPRECPVCGHAVRREPGEAASRCVNKLCPAVRRQTIIHFVSKAGLDVQGIGKKWIEILVDREIVKAPSDLFRLKEDDLLKLDRMGEKLAENFVQSLDDARKNATLSRLVAALGIRHVGEQTARALAERYRNLDELGEATVEELQGVPDIGPEVASSIAEFFADEGNRSLLAELKTLGLWPVSEPKAAGDEADGPLAGKTMLFTGTLSTSRDAAQKLAEQAGAKVVKSISKSVDYLVAGASAGSKLAKAESLGVTVLSEDEFRALLSGGPVRDKQADKTGPMEQGSLL